MGLFFHKPKRSKTKRTELSNEYYHKHECSVCPLNSARVSSPKMPPSGSSTPLVYILGEAPGKVEDKLGEQFVGDSGQILRPAIPEKYRSKVRFNNVVRTRPPNNRNPSPIEIECCRPSVVRDIEQTKPKAIIGFGLIPLGWVGIQGSMRGWRGRRVPVRVGNHTCWYYPVTHPSAVIRAKSGPKGSFEYDRQLRIFRRDVAHAFKDLETAPNPVMVDNKTAKQNIKIITNCNDVDIKVIEEHLKRCAAKKSVGIDIETNALRPYGKGAKILSIAVGTGGRGGAVLAFPLRHRQATWTEKQLSEIEGLLWRFFHNAKCVKVAHNLGFELEWLSFFFGHGIIRGSRWGDSMAQAYTIDERKDGLSLEFCVLNHFGFNIKPISNLDRKDLDNEPMDKVLQYNGMDALWCHQLYLRQNIIIKKLGMRHVYAEQLQRIPTMVLTQLKGIEVDQDNVRVVQGKLTERIEEIKSKIQRLKVVQRYNKNENKMAPFNPGSNDHVAKVLRDYLKRQEGLLPNNKYSTKEEVLKTIDHPIASLVLQYRTAVKLKSTYVDVLEAPHGKCIWQDGLIHTVLNTVFTDTGRLSSDSPNIQNFPKRHDQWVRSMIVAPKGCLLVSVDYGQIEARVIAVAAQDKYLMKALWERYDVHMEWAERIAHAYPKVIGGKKFINDKDTMKELRQTAKSDFVFASFYGAVAKTSAGRLGIPLSIAEKLLNEFWAQFSGVRDWQERLYKFYNTHGYVECLTGRRRHAPLTENMICNTPIQGTASDIVVDAMNRLSERASEEAQWKYQAVMNIHDDLSFYLPEKTIDEDICTVVTEMLDVPYDFMADVPVQVDVAVGPNWAEMDEIGKFFSDEWL